MDLRPYKCGKYSSYSGLYLCKDIKENICGLVHGLLLLKLLLNLDALAYHLGLVLDFRAQHSLQILII